MPFDPSGHRKRLQERFLSTDGNSLPDYEFLELILTRCIPRRDVKPLAKQLLKHFFSFAAVLHADPEELKQFKGIKESTITMFKIILEANKYLLLNDLKCQPVFSQWQNVIDYCRISIGYETVERFIVFYLDKNMKLVRQETSSSGTCDQVHLYPREVLKKALSLNAVTVILAHNHPSADIKPSQDDIRLTKELRRILYANGIHLADHLIIGGNKEPYSIINRLNLNEDAIPKNY